jgi:hypothetical protein
LNGIEFNLGENMSLSKEIEKLKYDKRLQEWYLSRGLMSAEELKKHLDSLQDLATNVEAFQLGDEAAGSKGDIND